MMPLKMVLIVVGRKCCLAAHRCLHNVTLGMSVSQKLDNRLLLVLDDSFFDDDYDWMCLMFHTCPAWLTPIIITCRNDGCIVDDTPDSQVLYRTVQVRHRLVASSRSNIKLSE